MKLYIITLITLMSISVHTLSARCARRSCAPAVESACCCPTFSCCDGNPYCGPFERPLPGDYASFKDNTRIQFWHLPPCAPRNDSAARGYLYKGAWWDSQGVRYWAFRNTTNNTIIIEGLEGGEGKAIPSGDVVNINRGESYSFRVQSPARRFELFNSDIHDVEIYINGLGDLDYREVQKIAKNNKVISRDNQPFNPKF